jgi:hypothetical protein
MTGKWRRRWRRFWIGWAISDHGASCACLAWARRELAALELEEALPEARVVS